MPGSFTLYKHNDFVAEVGDVSQKSPEPGISRKLRISKSKKPKQGS